MIFFDFFKMCPKYNFLVFYHFLRLPGPQKADFRPYITIPATMGQFIEKSKNVYFCDFPQNGVLSHARICLSGFYCNFNAWTIKSH